MGDRLRNQPADHLSNSGKPDKVIPSQARAKVLEGVETRWQAPERVKV